MPLERQIQKSIVDLIRERYGDEAQVRVLHGSRYSTVGDPDLYASIRGQTVVIETKQPGKKLRAIQHKRLREWATAGAIAIKADDKAYVASVLDRYVDEARDTGILCIQGSIEIREPSDFRPPQTPPVKYVDFSG